MKKAWLVILGLCCVLFTNAQIQPSSILQKSIDKINSLKSVSYRVQTIEKNPFSNGDTSYIKTQEILAFDRNGLLHAMDRKTSINKGQTELREVYLNDTLYNINSNDSLYSIDKKPKNIGNGLKSFVDLIKYILTKNPSKITQRKDTAINRTTCYNFFIKSYDTIENNNHNYTHLHVFINKTSLMPISTKEVSVGEFSKEGHSLGRLNAYNEVHYSSYRFSEKISPTVFHFNTAGFELYNDKMLADGISIPEINVKDLNNREVATFNFKNKLLLIEFGSTVCGANPLANPMLNRLNKKYNVKDVAIVSIYSEETSDQIKKYIESNSIEFPIYMGNKKIKRNFKTVGTPGFYLVNKDGKVIKSSNGYNDELENDFSKEIEVRIQNKGIILR